MGQVWYQNVAKSEADSTTYKNLFRKPISLKLALIFYACHENSRIRLKTGYSRGEN